METRQTPWAIRYHDGNANGFRFWQQRPGDDVRFEYSPVQPANSSSGTYSGGEPRSGTVELAVADALWNLVERLEADRSLHASARAMGTGAVRITTPAGDRAFLLERGPGLDELEAFVARFRHP
jgi:hypothetical protein